MSARILFVHNHLARFVAIDRDLLRERWAVCEWQERTRRVNLLALARAVRQSDLVFGWFASWHTFWPTLLARWLRKPVVMVIGGYDTANLPEIAYGHQRGGPKKWLSRAVVARADRLIVNSHYIFREAQQNLGVSPDRLRVIYHGLPDSFGSLATRPRDRLVMTVGNVDHSNLARKGHVNFVRSAAYLPDVAFVLIGEWRDDAIHGLKSIASPNVTFTGRLSDAALHDYYRRAAVYVQLSRHEGFGLAVAEAMLGGCIPVVSRVGALPEVVGETGEYIDCFTPAALVDGLRSALERGDRERLLARQRILDRFPLSRRRDRLHTLLSELLHASTH